MARFHRNLHNAKRGGPQWVETRRGRVHQYLDSVYLVGVSTRIQPAGAAKCRETGVRSVCAYFDGEVGAPAQREGRWLRVAYDPRVDGAFTTPGEPWETEGRPWNRADAVRLEADGSAWVLNPSWEA